jgi:hypothetical protein
MTIFQLARMRRVALTGLYLQTLPGYPLHVSHAAAGAAAVMTREQLTTAIVATRQGQRLLKGGA